MSDYKKIAKLCTTSISGVAWNVNWGPSLPSPLFPVSFYSLLFSSFFLTLFSFPPLPPLKVGPLKLSSSAGSAAEHQPKSNLVHYSFKIWDLVATTNNVYFFFKINWPTLVQFKRMFMSCLGNWGGLDAAAQAAHPCHATGHHPRYQKRRAYTFNLRRRDEA